MDPNNVNNLPVPTLDEVEKVFDQLLTEDGETTTLQVKQELRNNGYWVSQNEISNACHLLYRDNPTKYKRVFLSGHKVYSFAPQTATPVTTVAPTQPVVQVKVFPDAVEIQIGQAGDWEVESPSEKIFVKGDTSRNKARAFLSKKTGEEYLTITAVRIKRG